MMFCQKCGAQVPDNALTCPTCGALQGNAKYCRFCGQAIDGACVVCPKCGKQVEEIRQERPQYQQPAYAAPQYQQPIVINNTATASAVAGGYYGRKINKWVAFLLCVLLGYLGAHKFYEGKIGMGILYLFTFGLFGFGWFIDCIVILFKPNPYFVNK